MTAFLTILKVLGILLLTVLCLILTAALLFLFVPFRYRADGSYAGRPEACVRVTWLLHLISFQAAFDETFSYRLRLCGIRLLPRAERRNEKKKPADTAEDKLPSEQKLQAEKETEAEKTQNTRTEDACAANDTCAETSGGEKEEEETAAHKKKNKKASLSDRISSFADRLRKLAGRLYNALKKAAEQVSWYKSVFEKTEVKRAVRLAWDQFCRIVRHVMPGKTDICLTVGTGDPALTGQLLAVQGVLYPLLRGSVLILPDFEQRRFEGSFHIKGHVTAFTLLICALRVFFNRDIRYMIKLLRKKEEVSNGGE